MDRLARLFKRTRTVCVGFHEMDIYDRPDTLARQERPDIPIICFRPAALQQAALWFLSNIPGKILYAVKANPAPYVLEALYAAGIAHFDAASLTEIELVKQHCPGAHIAFMHPVKSRLAIEQAYFDHGVRDFSFDSMGELEKIVTMTGKSADLGLFLRLSVSNATAELPLANKFGCAPSQAAALLKAARKVSKRLGICFHVGSQTMDPQTYTSTLHMVGDILRSIPRTKVDIIDIGGGFPSRYPNLSPPSLSAYRDAINKGIAALPRQPDAYEIWCEPGRALVAESASILARVELRKGHALYLNDGTYGSLFDAGSQIGFRYPTRLIRTDGRDGAKRERLQPFSFYGPTCDSIDYMPGPFMLPADVREGDYIEIGQLGAYGNVMRTAFNGFDAHRIVTVQTPPLLTMYKETAPAALCPV